MKFNEQEKRQSALQIADAIYHAQASRPTRMHGVCGEKSFHASVTADGADWDVKITLATGIVENRFVSTIQARPDNGALHVSCMLRRDFNITGIFATN